jgi:hypothetical protein
VLAGTVFPKYHWVEEVAVDGARFAVIQPGPVMVAVVVRLVAWLTATEPKVVHVVNWYPLLGVAVIVWEPASCHVLKPEGVVVAAVCGYVEYVT